MNKFTQEAHDRVLTFGYNLKIFSQLFNLLIMTCMSGFIARNEEKSAAESVLVRICSQLNKENKRQKIDLLRESKTD